MYNIFPVFWVFYVNKIEALNDAFIKTLLQILRNAIHILPSHIDKKKMVQHSTWMVVLHLNKIEYTVHVFQDVFIQIKTICNLVYL
jgi:hypothetical protein